MMQSNNDIQAQSSHTGLFQYLQTVGIFALNLVFPPRCVRCNRVGAEWCAYCADDLNTIAIIPHAKEITGCDEAWATGVHEGVLAESIYALKYESALSVGDLLSQRLIHMLELRNLTFNTIIPVPLHTKKFQQRGYNQSTTLSRGLESHFKIPVVEEGLIRQRETQSQVGLGFEARQDNMSEAFIANCNDVEGKTILLVDDVMTTGATLSECAKALRQAGATQVFAVCVSVARGS